MENKEHIKNTIQYLKDDRPTPEYDAKKKYLEELEYLQPIQTTKFSDFRKKFFENLETKTGWGKEQLKKLFDDTYFEMSNENIN